MTITLYGSIGSRASRCLWTAEEIGLAYAWRQVSTADGSSRTPDYLAISPSGVFPALTDGDVAITESFAINQYLAETYGRGGVWPESAASRAQVLQWSFWSATELEYCVGALFAELVLKPEAARDTRLAEMLRAALRSRLGRLETALGGGDYLLGAFTLADIATSMEVFTMTDRLGFETAEFPHIARWEARCRMRPARRAVDALAARPVP